jgi:hypothetical protein
MFSSRCGSSLESFPKEAGFPQADLIPEDPLILRVLQCSENNLLYSLLGELLNSDTPSRIADFSETPLENVKQSHFNSQDNSYRMSNISFSTWKSHHCLRCTLESGTCSW